MIDRRSLISSGLAALAAPAIVPSAARATQIDPRFAPQQVNFAAPYAPGRLIVLPRAFPLFRDRRDEARRYGVGVGRAGLEFTGTPTIDVKKKWPPGDPPTR